MEFIETLKAEWPVIEQAPFSFIAMAVVLVTLTFIGVTLLWHTRVISAEARLKLRDDELAALERELKAAPTRNRQEAQAPDFETWSKIQEFHLYEVAYLWAEARPPAKPVEPPRGRPAETYRMLREAVEKEQLAARHLHATQIFNRYGKQVVVPPGAHPTTLITRDALVEFCALHSHKPKFLFPPR